MPEEKWPSSLHENFELQDNVFVYWAQGYKENVLWVKLDFQSKTIFWKNVRHNAFSFSLLLECYQVLLFGKRWFTKR